MNNLIFGCGYLGLRVAGAWQAGGHHVAALTRSAVRAEQLRRAGIQPIVGDICEPSTLQGLPQADTVLYAVGYDRTSGQSRQSVTVDGLRNALQAISGRAGRLIFISSSSVYGQSDGEWVDETSECHPVQPGGGCCLAAEDLVRSFAAGTAGGPRMQINVLRLSGIYGPGRLLSRVESLRAGEPIAGRGDAWLNLIHVSDAVRTILACEQRGAPDQTYLVTDDRPIRRAEYYGLLAELTGAPAPRFDPDSPAVRGSGGINKRCRNRRIRTELQVELAYPTINEGLPQSLGELVAPPAGPPDVPAG